MAIDVRRLEALVALARTGTVTAAAASLHYGQSTITHHLHELQRETGTVLFQRVGRNVRLTADGERLAKYGVEVLGLLKRAEADLESATALRAGRVRMAVFPSAIATMVPPLLERMREHASGVTVDLVEAEPPQAMDLLVSGDVDLALAFSYASQDVPSRFTSVSLFDDPLFLVAPATSEGEAIGGFAGSRWVTGCEQCRGELMNVCRMNGFSPDIAMATDDYVAVQALVACGYGVTILPRLALRAYRHPDVRVAQVHGHARTVQVLALGEPPLPAAIAATIDALRAVQIDYAADYN